MYNRLLNLKILGNYSLINQIAINSNPFLCLVFLPDMDNHSSPEIPTKHFLITPKLHFCFTFRKLFSYATYTFLLHLLSSLCSVCVKFYNPNFLIICSLNFKSLSSSMNVKYIYDSKYASFLFQFHLKFYVAHILHYSY